MRILPSTSLLVSLVGAATCALGAGSVEDVGPQRSHAAAPVRWTDESGRARNLSELAGYPVVLLPMYTRCPSACLQTVAQLKQALGDSAAEQSEFRVLLFSFDPTETPASLAAYRRREAIPLSWLVGAADQANIDALLQSIGFQSTKAGGQFMHPNLVVFLDSKLRVAKWIYGTGYTPGDLDSALKIAGGQSDWVGRHFDILYSVLIFAAVLLCVALVQQFWRPPAPAAVPRA